MAIKSARVKINGEWHDLTYNPQTSLWEAIITAPGSSTHEPGGMYTETVEAVNEVGNIVTADGDGLPTLRLKVVERVKPVITLITPENGWCLTDSMGPIVLGLTDDDSGIDLTTLRGSFDGEPMEFTVETSDGGYRATWTPEKAIEDGYHVLHAEITDYDGNTGTLDADITVDTRPPTLILFTRHFIVDTDSIEIGGYAHDWTTPPVSVTVAKNGEVIDTPATESNHHFYFTVPLDIAENYVTITVEDRAGLKTVENILVFRLVTDRTQADVDRLISLMEIGLENMGETDRAWYMDTVCRGAYNPEDFNRVNRAMAYLQRRLKEYGYLPSYRDQGILWEYKDIPEPAETNGYLANVNSFRHVLALDEEPPETPEDMDEFTFEEANDIEKILVMADTGFVRMGVSDFISDEIFCGEF